ncbi:AAA family ATPase, partial [Arthrospira platensis SPKY2]
MQINHLKITNFRGFEQAEFEFQPGMNLIVGINGVGKSSVLDALRIAF